jgi:hypothetical protein
MDKKNKIFFLVMTLLIIGAVGVTYWRIMIEKDYVIEAEIDCEPTEEACFIWECDPEGTEDWEMCTGDPDEDIWYYKLVRRNAGNIPLCDPEEDEECDPYTCEEGEADCEEILCEEDNEDEIECNDPEQYVLDNPEEEEEECEEGDGECLLEEDEEIMCEEGDEECETMLDEETLCEEDDEECMMEEEEEIVCEEGDEECEATLEEEDALSADEAVCEEAGDNACEEGVLLEEL